MNIDFFEILLLSAIQGISEFIPVSSSAHLFLISDIYNFKVQSLLTDIGLHLGSLLAIITYFNSDLANIFKNKKLLLLVTFGSAPVIFIGAILYQTNLILYLRNIEIIAWTTLIFAILLYFADKVKVNKKLDTNLGLKSPANAQLGCLLWVLLPVLWLFNADSTCIPPSDITNWSSRPFVSSVILSGVLGI